MEEKVIRCDICKVRHAKEDLVANEIITDGVEKFEQWNQVCNKCFALVVGFIKSIEK